MRTKNLFIAISLVKLNHSHRKYSRKKFYRRIFLKCHESDEKVSVLKMGGTRLDEVGGSACANLIICDTLGLLSYYAHVSPDILRNYTFL